MRVTILDPGLMDAGTHFLEWDLRLIEQLVSLGHTVNICSHVDINPTATALASAQATLSPIFRVSCYVQPAQLDPIAGDLMLFVEGASTTAEDLRRVEPSDLWMWPTFNAWHLYACALLGTPRHISACIHQEPTFNSPNGNIWWRYAFISAMRAKLGLNLGVTVQPLVNEYAGLTSGQRISRFAAAHDGVPGVRHKTSPTRIGFFGFQRQEKGVEILPSLVPQLIKDGHEVVMHDSGGMVQVEATDKLTVLGFVPSLAQEIARCDLVVAPYLPQPYRVRGSGIVWDCIASGVPVIVPGGTACGDLVRNSGSGKTFPALSAQAVYGAIQAAKQDYAVIARAAGEASRRWPETDGSRRFAQAMLQQVDPN